MKHIYRYLEGLEVILFLLGMVIVFFGPLIMVQLKNDIGWAWVYLLYLPYLIGWLEEDKQ